MAKVNDPRPVVVIGADDTHVYTSGVVTAIVDNFYANVGNAGPYPLGYVYLAEGEKEVLAMQQRHAAEQKELRDRQYREMVEMRKKYGWKPPAA